MPDLAKKTKSATPAKRSTNQGNERSDNRTSDYAQPIIATILGQLPALCTPRIAAILLDSMYIGDSAAAVRNHCDRSTVWRIRQRYRHIIDRLQPYREAIVSAVANSAYWQAMGLISHSLSTLPVPDTASQLCALVQATVQIRGLAEASRGGPAEDKAVKDITNAIKVLKDKQAKAAKQIKGKVIDDKGSSTIS